MTKHRLTFGMESAAVLGLLVLAAAAGGCDTGVPSSPEPGIFRLELQRDISATTSIRVAGNQFVLGNDTTRAALRITLTDARAYRDTNYAELTRNLRTVEEADATLNVLEDSQTEATKTYTLYESFLPPAEYDSLRLTVSPERFTVASSGKVFSGFNFSGNGDGLQLRPGLSGASTFPRDTTTTFFPFRVRSNDTTVVRLKIDPLGSLNRVVDQYHFAPAMQVSDVTLREGEANPAGG
jgi:hypothetical protein